MESVDVLEERFKEWCHRGCPHERRVIAAVEERIGMGAWGGRRGRYFSTQRVSSQRHDRPAGGVSAQIRLSFHSGWWWKRKKKKIKVLKMTDMKGGKRNMKIVAWHVLCQAFLANPDTGFSSSLTKGSATDKAIEIQPYITFHCVCASWNETIQYC